MLRPFPSPFLRAHRLSRLRHYRSFYASSSNLYPKSLKTFNLADIGEGITECEIIKWSVTPSSRVQAFDPLCEVQSDKASVEITSPFDGVLKEVLVKEGEMAKVGEGLCLIEVESENELEGEGKSEGIDVEGKAREEPVQEEERVSPTPTTERKKHPMDPTYVPPTSSSTSSKLRQPSKDNDTDIDILAPPSVRFFARQNGVDLRDVAPGSGKGGRVEKRDVLAFMDGGRKTSTTSTTTTPTTLKEDKDIVVELGRTRYGMWKAMEKSLLIPHFSYTSYLDLTPLHSLLPLLNTHIPPHYLPDSHPNLTVNRRERYASAAVSPYSIYRGAVEEDTLTQNQGREGMGPIPPEARYTKLTYLPFLLKTLSRAMMEWPVFRATVMDSSSTKPNANAKPSLSIRPHADIALALSTPSGLYSPVLKSVEGRSVYEIAGEVKRLSELARGEKSRLGREEFDGTPIPGNAHTNIRKGATLSVSNIGAIGHGTAAHPVLVPGGGVAIVAIGRAKWEWDADPAYDGLYDHDRLGGVGPSGAGVGRRRLLLPISFSADHRVVEGAEMAAFVETWRSWVEEPGRGVGIGV